MITVATYAEAVRARRQTPPDKAPPAFRWTDEFGRAFVWPSASATPFQAPQPSRVKREDGTFAVHASCDKG